LFQLLEDFVKFILFIRNQIPIPYDQFPEPIQPTENIEGIFFLPFIPFSFISFFLPFIPFSSLFFFLPLEPPMKKPKLSQYERDLKRRSSKFLNQSNLLFQSIRSLSFIPEKVLFIFGSSSINPKETYMLKIDQLKQIIHTNTTTATITNPQILRKRISGILIQSLMQNEKFMTNTLQNQIPTNLHLFFLSEREIQSIPNFPFIPKQTFEPNYGEKQQSKLISKKNTNPTSCHFEITLNIELKQQPQQQPQQQQKQQFQNTSEKCWYYCTNILKGFSLSNPSIDQIE